MANKGTGCNTADTSGSEHGSRVAALLLFGLVGGCSRWRVVVSLVAMGVSEKATFIVTTGWHVRCACGRRSIC